MYQIPYDRTFIDFDLPAGMRGAMVEPKSAQPLADVDMAIGHAMSHPTGAPPLSELAQPGDKVCVVFTDVTRPCPDHLLVPAILKELDTAQVPHQNITLLCAVGLHRPSTLDERLAILGETVVNRYRIIDSEPRNPAVLVDLGVTQGGVPVSIHKAAVEADLLISTGLVEPHQYAGYSGGSKTVAVGAAGEALIAYTHGPALLDDPGTQLGRIDDNPFCQAITEAAYRAGLCFVLNVVLNSEKQIVFVRAGEPVETHRQLVMLARSICEESIPQQYSVVVAGVAFPKGANLYQATRAASQLALAQTPVVRQGGVVIIAARCQEGPGSGVGEQRFFAAMRDAHDVTSILDRVRLYGCVPGEQRAFVLAKALQRARVVIVGSDCPDVVEACKMTAVPRIEDALDLVANELGDNQEVLILPNALSTLPVVSHT